jgi:hypothetical protein
MLAVTIFTKNAEQRRCKHKVAFEHYYEDANLVDLDNANDMYNNNTKFNYCPMCGAKITWKEV